MKAKNKESEKKHIGYVKNKRSQDPSLVWVGGCYKKELEEAGIKVLKSEHDWGNWIFLVDRQQYYEITGYEDPVRINRYGQTL